MAQIHRVGFKQQPENTVIYGAFVVDDTARIDRKVTRQDLPCLLFPAL